MIDYRLNTFLVLCDCMNYRKAAEILHITQPAITQQIHFLEREYDCKLFTYDNRRLYKTDAARTLEQYARAAKYHDQNLREKLAESAIYELKIGATKTIGDYVLQDHIYRYLDRQDHTLSLVVDNTEHLLYLLEENKLDFAVIEGFFDKERFDSMLFRREPFVGICHKAHPFANREVTIEELFQETIIHREDGSGTRAILEQELTAYNESLERFKHHISISSFKVIVDLVKNGYGISFVYEVLADSDPFLAKFILQQKPIMREFNIVYLKHTDPQEKIARFFGKDLLLTNSQ